MSQYILQIIPSMSEIGPPHATHPFEPPRHVHWPDTTPGVQNPGSAFSASEVFCFLAALAHPNQIEHASVGIDLLARRRSDDMCIPWTCRLTIVASARVGVSSAAAQLNLVQRLPLTRVSISTHRARQSHRFQRSAGRHLGSAYHHPHDVDTPTKPRCGYLPEVDPCLFIVRDVWLPRVAQSALAVILRFGGLPKTPIRTSDILQRRMWTTRLSR